MSHHRHHKHDQNPGFNISANYGGINYGVGQQMPDYGGGQLMSGYGGQQMPNYGGQQMPNYGGQQIPGYGSGQQTYDYGGGQQTYNYGGGPGYGSGQVGYGGGQMSYGSGQMTYDSGQMGYGNSQYGGNQPIVGYTTSNVYASPNDLPALPAKAKTGGFIGKNTPQLSALTSTMLGGTANDVFQNPFRISKDLNDSLQWYSQVKRDICSRKILFEDPHFQAIDSSLFYSSDKPEYKFEWKRPSEFVRNPQFISDGLSRFDVCQGELGDCWLLAAIASLSMHANLMSVVIPENQSFTENYCGMFLFRFWQYGQWVDVVVDDRLPAHNGNLVFLHSKDQNEFWSALFEKAYAKLQGSYEALKGGSSSEAMEDFTGGITEMFELKEQNPETLWHLVHRANKFMSLMGCSVDDEEGVTEGKGPMGLITGHAYSITSIATVKTSRGPVNLIRVRNPWGDDSEWTGPWSDNSSEWKEIDQNTRNTLGLHFDSDGEFWMSFNDFCRYFTKLEICHLSVDAEYSSLYKNTQKVSWKEQAYDGQWLRNVSAGGCRNFIDTFQMNPQYHVTVTDPDDTDNENNGTLIVGLMQKNMRQKRREGKDLLTIGYVIYKFDQTSNSNSNLLDTKFFKANTSIAKVPAFINLREVCGRHKLPVGEYVIVPSSFNPNEEADFLIRIFTEKPLELKQLDETTTILAPTVPVDPTQPASASDPTPFLTLNPKEEAQLHKAFLSVAGPDVQIDAYQLRDILNHIFKQEFKFDGFGTETSRSLVSYVDKDKTGKMGFDEFKHLWCQLRLWKSIFKQFDSDKSGDLNSYELRNVFRSVGFTLSNKIFYSVCTRYSRNNGTISFDDYILLVVRLKTIFECFISFEKDENDSSKAIVDQDDFLTHVLYF